MNDREKNRLLIEVSESVRTDFGKVDFRSQSFPQKIFSAIWDLESEVNSGGFCQYFLNSSNETAHFLVEALGAIGASDTAEICKRAIDTAFPAGLPLDPNTIHESAERFPDETRDALDFLDREFFKYPNDLTELLYAHVAKHPEEFGHVPRATVN
jgi:hypothetical protein